MYGENVKIIKPGDLTFTSSDDKWVVCETFACELINGDPTKINGQTLYQDASANGSILPANGSIYSVDRFYLDNKIYYKLKNLHINHLYDGKKLHCIFKNKIF